MLLGEQGRRHEDRGLLAVLDRLEDGAHRDLGLAEADVAADEAVHRGGPLHVRLDVVDRLELVGGLDVGERLLELDLPGGVGREGVAGLAEAALVEHDELLGDLAHGAAHPRLGALPVAAAEPAERRLLAAGVGRDRVDLVGGDVEAVVAAVLEQQVVALGAADRARHHPAVAGDAVDVVHDVVARGEVVEEPVGGRGPRPRRAVRAAAAGEVGLGEHGELGRREDEAAVEAAARTISAPLDPLADARHPRLSAQTRSPSPSAQTTTR